jgi:[acyl-carrier-protein] S-malonyltransferase
MASGSASPRAVRTTRGVFGSATGRSPAASAISANKPLFPLYTNRDGSVVTDGDTYVGYLVDQVARPVRWDLCMESFAGDGIQGMMELAPSGALSGLAKRGLKGVPTVAISSPQDVDLAADLVTGA